MSNLNAVAENNPLEEFRGKILHLYMVLGIIISLFMLPVYYFFGLMISSIGCAIFSLLMAVVLWQYRANRIERHRGALFVSGSALLLILIGNYFGNEVLDSKPWLILYPIIAYTLNPPRTGLYWSIVALVTAPTVLIINIDSYSVASISLFMTAMLVTTYVFYVFSKYNESNAAELMHSHDKYQGIFDDSVAAIYVFDHDKNFIDSNQAGLDLLGYSREELLNMSIPDVDADQGAVVPAHKHLLSGGRIVNFEHRMVHKDGHVVSVLNNSRPLTDSKGEVTGMQSTLIDITERKQAENELNEALISQQAILVAIPDLMFELDDEGRYLNIWARNSDELAHSEDKLLGRTVSEMLPTDAADQVMVALREAYEKGQSYGHKIHLPTPNGDSWFELSTSLKDGRAIPHRFIMSSRNITQRKMDEEEIRFNVISPIPY